MTRPTMHIISHESEPERLIMTQNSTAIDYVLYMQTCIDLTIKLLSIRCVPHLDFCKKSCNNLAIRLTTCNEKNLPNILGLVRNQLVNTAQAPACGNSEGEVRSHV